MNVEVDRLELGSLVLDGHAADDSPAESEVFVPGRTEAFDTQTIPAASALVAGRT